MRWRFIIARFPRQSSAAVAKPDLPAQVLYDAQPGWFGWIRIDSSHTTFSSGISCALLLGRIVN